MRNKLDGSQFKVADIYKTKVCPLAKVIKKRAEEEGRQETQGRILGRDSDKADRRDGKLENNYIVFGAEQSAGRSVSCLVSREADATEIFKATT